MSNVSRILAIAALAVFGCDDETSVTSRPAELERSAVPVAADEADEFEWSEDPASGQDAAVSDLSDVDRPSKGTCGGYWDYSSAQFQGCGSCWHTLPDPDRPGNLGKFYRRWCWTGPGCASCEPWVYTGSQCYDNC